MTPTEKKYRQHLGQLFWSVQRGSLVLVIGLTKSYGRWRYLIEYTAPHIESKTRHRDATEITKLIKQGRWMTAAQFIKLREESQGKNSS